jgi:hypothetical protein
MKGDDMLTAAEYERAERELTLREAGRGWRIHAAFYAIVTTGLIVLNVLLVAYTDASFYWFPFPLVGWGVGLTMHYLFGVRWAEREVRARQARVERYARETSLAT